MADIWWMLEQKFRGRTAELLAHFHNEADADISTLSADQLASLQGFAKNTVLLLRENKTRCVRQEQAASDQAKLGIDDLAGADFRGVKTEIDEAVAEVLAYKAELSRARVRLLSESAEPASQVTIDLTEKLLALDELRRRGVLTDAEFRRAKKMLI